jgi:uncharacterized membrane protein
MNKTISDIAKSLKAVETFQNIMLKPQMVEAFDRMSASVERLSSQLAGLNSAMLEQNKQLGESMKETKRQAIELRQELEKLNDVNSKSHSIFEEMKRAGEVTDKLTRVMVVFTVIITSVGLYPILTDILRSPADDWSHTFTFILCIGMGIGWCLILKWVLNRQGNTAQGK